jgi:hypothetical protein
LREGGLVTFATLCSVRLLLEASKLDNVRRRLSHCRARLG